MYRPANMSSGHHQRGNLQRDPDADGTASDPAAAGRSIFQSRREARD
jgi:hypothetical protein